MRQSEVKDFVSTDSSISTRIFVFFLTNIVWFCGFYYLNPLLQNFFSTGQSLSLFLKHLLYFSLSTTLMCVACYSYFLSKGSFKKIQIFLNKRIMAEAFIVALFCCLITIPFAYKYGYHLGFNFDLEKAIGNIFSNTYEEFQYRVLIFFGALYLFQRLIPAALLSGLVFALSHSNYPIEIQATIMITGTLTAVSYFRTKSFVTAILIHQIIDLILDTILIN
ncbi:CPBP family intramembrane metalloprotease [bacterium]|nr:CPBP family intramembrane metalloprotease [bacterium]